MKNFLNKIFVIFVSVVNKKDPDRLTQKVMLILGPLVITIEAYIVLFYVNLVGFENPENSKTYYYLVGLFALIQCFIIWNYYDKVYLSLTESYLQLPEPQKNKYKFITWAVIVLTYSAPITGLCILKLFKP